MTTEETSNSAQTGQIEQGQNPLPNPLPQGEGAAAVQFSAEQQAAVDRIVAERLRRAQEKWRADQDAKAAADTDAAEAKRLADEAKWQELARKREAEAVELKAKLAQVEYDQQRRDVAQAAGIPQLWERLRGETAEALTEDAKALAAMMQPAGGRGASTQPTPPAQTGGPTDFVKQAIERQQKRATENDPYAAMMRK